MCVCERGGGGKGESENEQLLSQCGRPVCVYVWSRGTEVFDEVLSEC